MLDALLFIIAITLHNIEEALWLPRWSRGQGRFRKPVDDKVFIFAVSAVTLLACAVSGTLAFRPDSPFAGFLFRGFVGAMMVNTAVPHVASTVIDRQYCPGTATGILLIWPAGVFIISRALAHGETTGVTLILSAAVVAAVLAGLLPLLFIVGRKLMTGDGR